MRAVRHRSAWILVAMAAFAVSCAARVQAGMDAARPYADPVLALLNSAEPACAPADWGGAWRAQHRGLHADPKLRSMAGAHPVSSMLPVCFVGLISPLNLLPARELLASGETPRSPLRTASFQRPPPFHLL